MGVPSHHKRVNLHVIERGKEQASGAETSKLPGENTSTEVPSVGADFVL